MAFIKCQYTNDYLLTFEEGYAALKQLLKEEQIMNLCRFIRNGASTEEVIAMIG